MATVIPSDGCGVEVLFSAYLDGELGPGELDQVVGHLGTCGECIAAFHELKAVRSAVRTMPQLQVPEWLLPNGHYPEELSAYLDGALSNAEHTLVSDHLAGCTECRDELHELDAARTAVRSLPVLEPPSFLDLRRAHPVPVPRRRRFAGLAAGVAAAAVAAFVVAGGTGTPRPDVDLDMLADQHTARVSVEPGFSIVPAMLPAGGEQP